MFHFQESVTDWPRAVAKLPKGSLIKAVDRGDILRDAKAVNPGVITMLRHHGGPQSIFDGRGFEGYKQLAREFFATFIDGTFRQQYAQHTDLVQEWNEYLASSHSGQELQDRIDWARAAAYVWKHEYRTRPEYSHIRLALVSAPVGNDIHRAFAEIAIEYDAILSYHAYDKFIDGQRDPLSWRYHCGRWAYMEQSWGLKPDWVFGEAGPYAGVLEGWRHSSVLNGDRNRYVEAMRRWVREIAQTPAYREGRVKGFALFTTGRAGDVWKYYWTEQPEMDAMAEMLSEEWEPGTEPPPEPPPPPEPRRYHRTVHLLPQDTREDELAGVVEAAYARRESIMFSADDAFINAPQLTGRTVYVWEPERVGGSKTALEAWVKEHYAPIPTIIYRRINSLFYADAWDAPVGTEEERQGPLWPGAWIDANPFLNRYRLGNGFSIHTGADLNLNTPVADMDRNMPVYAAASGRVTYAGIPSQAWQRVIVMIHGSSGGERSFTRYGHLGAMLVRHGEYVKRGQMIGIVGRNMDGNTPGPFHLHFDISHTDVLLTQPGHWPGDNVAAVVANYVNPKQWIEARRG